MPFFGIHLNIGRWQDIEKLENVLGHICTGITHNIAVALPELLKYIHSYAFSPLEVVCIDETCTAL